MVCDELATMLRLSNTVS